MLFHPQAGQQQQDRHAAGKAAERRGRHAEQRGAERRQRQQRHQRQANTPAQRQRFQQRADASPAGAYDQPFMEAASLCPPFAEITIERLGGANFRLAGLGAHRHKSLHFAVAHDRHRIGAHPVMIAVFTAVFDQRRPGLALLQRRPHIGKRLWWHIGVAHHIVRLSVDLFRRKTADFNKGVVGVGDIAVDIGGRH